MQNIEAQIRSLGFTPVSTEGTCDVTGTSRADATPGREKKARLVLMTGLAFAVAFAIAHLLPQRVLVGLLDCSDL